MSEEHDEEVSTVDYKDATSECDEIKKPEEETLRYSTREMEHLRHSHRKGKIPEW